MRYYTDTGAILIRDPWMECMERAFDWADKTWAVRREAARRMRLVSDFYRNFGSFSQEHIQFFEGICTIDDVSASPFVIEGFGVGTTGGEGGTIYTIDRLDDVVGPGINSLREFVENTSGTRIIKSGVAGNIIMDQAVDSGSDWRIEDDANITIDFTDAPGKGTCVHNGAFSIRTGNNILIRNVRFRPGSATGVIGDKIDAMSVWPSEGPQDKMVFDHCSFSWGVDEIFQLYFYGNNPIYGVTVQHCIISEPCDFPDDVASRHTEGNGRHGFGIIFGGGSGSTPLIECSFHHNLLAHSKNRNPLIRGGKIDWVNNVIYNFEARGHSIPDACPIQLNMVNNYYKEHATASNGHNGCMEVRGNSPYSADSTWYAAGNYRDYAPGATQFPIIYENNNSSGAIFQQIQQRHAFPQVTTDTHTAAYTKVLLESGCGAITNKRDAIDDRIVQNVQNRNGSKIDDMNDVGGLVDLT